MIWLWNAFQWLSRRRTYHMSGPNAIGPQDMLAYCALRGIWKEEDVDQLTDIVGALDDAWLEDWHRREAERAKRDAGGKTGKRY
jgi:hypothetical protein